MKEILLILQVYNKKKKEEIKKDYELACMVASFVNCGMAGKSLPSISKVYPSLFSENEEKINAFRMMLEQKAKKGG